MTTATPTPRKKEPWFHESEDAVIIRLYFEKRPIFSPDAGTSISNQVKREALCEVARAVTELGYYNRGPDAVKVRHKNMLSLYKRYYDEFQRLQPGEEGGIKYQPFMRLLDSYYSNIKIEHFDDVGAAIIIDDDEQLACTSSNSECGIDLIEPDPVDEEPSIKHQRMSTHQNMRPLYHHWDTFRLKQGAVEVTAPTQETVEHNTEIEAQQLENLKVQKEIYDLQLRNEKLRTLKLQSECRYWEEKHRQAVQQS